jgi:hypothetical protein
MSNYFVKTFHYNGMTYEYIDDPSLTNRFTVEYGRYRNTYRPWSVHQDHHEAIQKYEGLRIAEGYKKRLIMVQDFHLPRIITIARFISPR